MAADDAELTDPGPLKPSIVVTAGAFLLMGAGLAALAAGLQLQLAIQIATWAKVLPPLMIVAGVVSMGVGGMLARARFWAAVLSLVLALFLGLLGVVWVAYALYHGFFAPLPLISSLVAFLAVPVIPFTLVPCWRVTRARKALFAEV